MQCSLEEDFSGIEQIRMRNVDLIAKGYPTKGAFCRAVGISASQFSQFYMDTNAKGHRKPGSRFCRQVEKSLKLPPNSLDQPNGAKPIDGTTKGRDTLSLRGLKALQIATVEALVSNIKDGTMSDAACVDLLTKLVGPRPVRRGS